jgi:hypothetical protein
MILEKNFLLLKSGIGDYRTFGTVLTTNLIQNEIQLDWHGIMWGMLAAASLPPQCLPNRVATISSTA